MKSDVYCADIYKLALENYEKAMFLWKAENKKFAFSRSFDSVTYYSQLAIEKGNMAKNRSLELSTGLKWYLRNQIDSVKGQKDFFHAIFYRLPLPESIQRQNTKGFLLLHEAEIAYDNKKYKLSEEKLVSAKESISYTYSYAFNLLNDYFLNSQQWQDMARATIEKSYKKKCTAIVVDKFSRSCYVYSAGKLKYSFIVELGPNWMADKRMKGDKATPEGFYKVTKKIAKPNTRYHKALLINYPNDKDLEQFNRAKQQKIIPENAHIGNLIEIHGHGNQGADWTNGCVALKNEDMDIVYRESIVGTPVTIVGSLKPINEILLMPEME
ncbi:MAG: L,D-transpeptidase family protein [Bacteroidales bacterium]|nr:L,D-transpeptidase family protein [Bacteroidales bacterium]